MSNRGSINVDINRGLNRLKKFREELGNKETARGISKVINETLRETRTKAKEFIGNRYNIPGKHLDSIVIETASEYKLTGKVLSDTQPLPLSIFQPKYAGADRGVSFSVLKGRRGKIGYAFMVAGNPNVYGRGHYLNSSPYGFIRDKGKNKSGKLSGRELEKKRSKGSQGRSPVTRMVTVSVNGALNSPSIKRRLENAMEKNFPKRFRTELQRRIDKLSK